jgi:hypothetical protein
MRIFAIAFALASALVPAAGARAATALQVRGVAARIAIVPEHRRDVSIVVLHSNSRLPMRMRTLGGRVVVTGDVNRRVRGCRGAREGAGGGGVDLWGRGRIPYADLPYLVVRTPMDVHVSVGDAVYGVIGRSASVDFTNQGCGDWIIANVRSRLRLDQAGAGYTRAGTAGAGDLSVAGSGRVSTRALSGPLTAVSSGSGNIDVAAVAGSVDVRVAGTGDVDIAGGQASHMEVSIAGSGDVHMRGQARSLTASVTGSGDVEVARVTGPVIRRVFGSGEVRIGP